MALHYIINGDVFCLQKNFLSCNWSVKSIFGCHKCRNLKKKREKMNERKKKENRERKEKERNKKMKALRKTKGMGVWLKRNWLPVLLQAMSKAVTMRHCRAFPGVLWRCWWRWQQQQLRKRQYWWTGRHKGNGSGCTAMGLSGVPEKVFAGQSKIYAYIKPNKCFGMCYPFQEENSVVHYEVKCQGKSLSGISRKPKEERNAGNMIQSSVKSDEQKMEEARRGPMASFPNQKTEAADPSQTLPSSCDSINIVAPKQALKKHLNGKQAPQKKISRENTAEEKTDRFPPSAKELQEEQS